MSRWKSLLLAITTLALAGSALACGNHMSFGAPTDWTPRRSWRSCSANLKTLAGAIEMYNLDFNTNTTELDEAFLKTLVEEGYLMEAPTCPNRQARGATGRGYLMAERDDPRGNWPEVVCLDHGFVHGPYQESAYTQLARSPANAHLLSRALRSTPQAAEARWKARRQWQERLWGVVVAMGGGPLMALLAFLG